MEDGKGLAICVWVGCWAGSDNEARLGDKVRLFELWQQFSDVELLDPLRQESPAKKWSIVHCYFVPDLVCVKRDLLLCFIPGQLSKSQRDPSVDCHIACPLFSAAVILLAATELLYPLPKLTLLGQRSSELILSL